MWHVTHLSEKECKVACEFEKRYISVISGRFHATRQNDQKHGKTFSEQELKNETRRYSALELFYDVGGLCNLPLFCSFHILTSSVIHY